MTKKTWNALSKRGLALFLALVMCMGMLPFSVFAEEAGAAAGDSITVSEDVVTPVIDQETEEEVKTPAEETEEEVKTPVEETEEEVKTPAEETEEEVKTPAEETEEEVKTPAEETEEEVKTPAEETEEEVKTPAEETEEEVKTPAEETAEEVPAPPANMDSVTAPIVGAVEDNIAETVEAPFIPTEVQAFLDAVDAIPEITPENAAEVAEYVYGEVSECYEALLGTEYEERQDVQEAVAVYAAAIEAVDAALNMESDDFAYSYQNIYDVELFVGQTVHHVFRPPNTQGFYGNNYTGEGFYLISANNTANCLSAGQVEYKSRVNTYNADGTSRSVETKVGVATLTGKTPGYCTAEYYYYYQDAYGYKRIGYQGYRITVKPTTQTQNHTLELKVGAVEDIEIGYAVNDRTPYSLNAIAVSQDAAIAAVDTPSVSGSTLTSAINGVSAGSTQVTYTATGYARGYSALGTYNNIPVTFIDNINVTVEDDDTAPTAPKREDLYGILGNFVKVVCTSDPVEPGTSTPKHTKDEEKLYSTWGNNSLDGKYESEVGTVYKDGTDWKVNVTLNGDVYTKMYSMYSMEPGFGTGVEHALASGEAATQTITLKWNASTKKWVEASGQPKKTVLATFCVACKANVPDAPTAEEVNNLVKGSGKSAVVVVDTTNQHDPGYFSCTESSRINIGTVQGDATNGYTCAVTFLASKYAEAYSTLKGKEHTLISGADGQNKTVNFKWNANTKKWELAANQAVPVEFKVECKAPNPSLDSLAKVRVTDKDEVAGAPDDVEYGAVVFKSDDQTVKLLYKITVTGTAGAKYKVTDAGAEWISGGTSHKTEDGVLVITGAIAEGQTTAVIYVTKTFSASAIQNNKLTNTANLESNDPVDPENPGEGGTEGPGPGKGEGSGSSDASETRNVTINFKTDDDNPVILQDPISKDYNKGGDFEGVTVNKPTARRAAPRASADTLVIPWKIEKDGKTYVLDEVASKDALDKLASLTSVTEDVLANLIYSLDMKGTIGTDGEGTPTDTSDDIPDKYQAKVTYVADNGGSVNKATEYVTITDDSGNLTTNGKIAVSATATPDGSHNFTGWTAVKGSEGETLTGTVTAELNAVISNVQGDKNNIPAYTITASFTEQQSFPTITLKCVKAEDNAVVLGTYTVSVDPTTGAYDVYDVLPYELLDADGVHYSWTSELRYPGNLEESGTVNKGDADAEFIAIYAVDTLIDPTVPEENRPAGGGDGIRDDWQFTVNYVAINGTVAPAQTVVTKYIEYEGHFYPSSVGEAKLAQEHLPTTAPNPGFTNGTWDTDPVVDMVIEDNITFTITYEAIVIPGNRVITINRTENGVVIDSVTVTVPQGSSYTVTGTDAPDSFDFGGNHYIRTGTRPTVPAGNDNVTVSVSYAIDNIGGGTDGKGSDGIPDNQEAVVYYTTSNEVYGTVASAYQTFNLGSANASGNIRLSNTASTTAMSRTYFSSWTRNGTVLSTGTALDVEFAVTAGSTYEVVANFGRSGGGGGGGTTGGGGGTTGGGGTGGGNTTIVDNEVPLAGDTQLNKEDHFAYVSGYEDGTVRPNNNITREEVAAIFYRLLTEESRAIYDTDVNDFSDVAARWSNKAISTLSNAGILSGYPDGTFRPGQTITRAEFAAIAAQFDVVTENVANPFSDTTGHWAETLISYAASKGWVSGYTDGTFLPQKAITRAEAMTLINNVLDREVDEEGLLAEAKQWPDSQQGSWYYYEVLEATNSHDYTRRSEGNLVENWTAITNQ